MRKKSRYEDNILRDGTGAPICIDFENGLEVQKVRYGDYVFVRRGGWHHDPAAPGVPDDQPFPFDRPRVLVSPSLDDIKRTFGPWWNGCWPQGMDLLHRLLRSIPGRRVPYFVWGDRLWVQVRTQARQPSFTRVYSRRTLDRLALVTRQVLQRDILDMPPWRSANVEDIMDRIGQVLAAAAEDGQVVP